MHCTRLETQLASGEAKIAATRLPSLVVAGHCCYCHGSGRKVLACKVQPVAVAAAAVAVAVNLFAVFPTDL